MMIDFRAAFLICAVITLMAGGLQGTQVEATQSQAVAPVLLPETAKISEHIVGLSGISNAGRIAPGIMRGNQPQPEGYVTLKKIGINTVINLRARHGEKEKVEAAGMRSIEFPISMLEKPRKSDVKKIVSMMSDPANQPVYVHCALGEDRTGIVVAAYRMDIDGWPLKDALDEMQAFGFNDQWIHLKHFITDYANNRNGR